MRVHQAFCILQACSQHLIFHADTSYELCKAALRHFDVQTPVKYALRPAVRRALEAGAADNQEVPALLHLGSSRQISSKHLQRADVPAASHLLDPCDSCASVLHAGGVFGCGLVPAGRGRVSGQQTQSRFKVT